jgi:hypothetical protein
MGYGGGQGMGVWDMGYGGGWDMGWWGGCVWEGWWPYFMWSSNGNASHVFLYTKFRSCIMVVVLRLWRVVLGPVALSKWQKFYGYRLRQLKDIGIKFWLYHWLLFKSEWSHYLCKLFSSSCIFELKFSWNLCLIFRYSVYQGIMYLGLKVKWAYFGPISGFCVSIVKYGLLHRVYTVPLRGSWKYNICITLLGLFWG